MGLIVIYNIYKQLESKQKKIYNKGDRNGNTIDG